MSKKKIVFVIVEGVSDEEAIGVILSRMYEKDAVYVHVVHGDITTELNVNPENIEKMIAKLVKDFALNKFKPDDFSQIIHITDTDGVFIPDECVIEDDTKRKVYYTEEEIRTAKKANIEERNRRKRENLRKLVTTEKIWNIEYNIYYMSCNLDHALYGKLNTTDEQKERNSFEFAKKYRDDIKSFTEFITESDFAVVGSYFQSWRYIENGLNSLNLHTNLGICFIGGEK